MKPNRMTAGSFTAVMSPIMVLVIGSVTSIAFADLEPRRAVVKPEHTTVDAGLYRTDVIMVKYRDGLQVRLRNDELTDFGTGALGGARVLLTELADGAWERSHSLPEERLDQLRLTAERNLNKAVADLNLQYNFYLPLGADVETTIDSFNAQESVEIALPIPLPVAPPLPPNFQPNQGYVNPAPPGIDASCMWLIPGGTGTGIRIADLEYSWNLSHQDLPATTLLGPVPNNPFPSNSHGTAVLGEISGLDNGWGVRGIAHGATMYVVSVNTGPGFGVYDVGAAITTALGTLVAGDIILLEQQIAGPNHTGIPAGTQFGLVPVEWNLGYYNAIVTAVGNGVIVVEAAANGAQNLDAPVFSTGNGGHWPFLLANDSGAIIVGAGAAPVGSDVARSRLDFSNFGATVDLQGWGENIYTTGYGDIFNAEGINQWYTATFGGTSGASPIVTGACATVQAAYRLATGGILTPAQMLTQLQATGSPQQAGTFPVAQNIGPLPNAVSAIIALVPSLDLDGNGILDECEDCLTTERQKLTASDAMSEDRFGFSFSISGDVAIVGAYLDDDNGTNSGSAYLFDTITRVQIAKLLPTNGAANDHFGISVAISGPIAIVGARFDDDNGTNSGSAYLFDTTTGAQITQLLPDDGAAGNIFGISVGISGPPGNQVAIVGAYFDDDNGEASGSAYLFDATTGAQITKLVPDDGASFDQFGISVAISGAIAIVGAHQDRDNGFGSGSAYLFDTTTGAQIAKLLASDGVADDRFGFSVAISRTKAIVGAWGDDDNGLSSGSAYIFDTTTGIQITKLLPDVGAAFDGFGQSVAISGAIAIVGARLDDENGFDAGSAYLFDTTTGQQLFKLLADDGKAFDHFGNSVAINDTTAIVGLWRDDVNGFESGSAYTYCGLSDCNGNNELDVCEIQADPTLDQNANCILDECDVDCNVNGQADFLDIIIGTSKDCNGNGVPDACDIADGTSQDTNGNGIPDICDPPCPANCAEGTPGGSVNVTDLLALLANWGGTPAFCDIAPPGGDGTVNITDLLAMLAAWGACP